MIILLTSIITISFVNKTQAQYSGSINFANAYFESPYLYADGEVTFYPSYIGTYYIIQNEYNVQGNIVNTSWLSYYSGGFPVTIYRLPQSRETDGHFFDYRIHIP